MKTGRLHLLLSCFLLASLCLPAPAPGGEQATAAQPPQFQEVPMWTPVAHPDGHAWAWRTDPAFRVLVVPEAHDEWSFGLYYLYKDTVHAVWVPGLCDPGVDCWIYQVWGGVREDTPPFVDGQEELVLALKGSSEHGCDEIGADQVTVRIEPKKEGPQTIQVRTAIEGIVYMGFPLEGLFEVDGIPIEPGEPTVFDAAAMPPGSAYEYTDFSGLVADTATLGTLYLHADPPLPWFQLQYHDGFLEVDMDHSCEDPLFTEANLLYVTRVVAP